VTAYFVLAAALVGFTVGLVVGIWLKVRADEEVERYDAQPPEDLYALPPNVRIISGHPSYLEPIGPYDWERDA
jgi:hypothetical protein